MNNVSGIPTGTRDIGGCPTAATVVEVIGRYWRAYNQRRAHNRAVASLRGWSDSQLKDIGISRSEIEFAVTDKNSYRTGRYRAGKD